MSTSLCDKTSRTKPQRMWDALGPFPRSAWIHPCTPEDSLDRACARVFKRSVLASKGIWPHLPENAHVFAEDGDTQSYRGHCGRLSTQSAGHQKLDKVMIMTQHNMTQTLLQGHVDATSPCFPDDRCRRGHEPDKTIEIISQEEADRDKNEEFLEEIIPKQATGKADIPEGFSDEDFPPLPPLSTLRVDRPPQQVPFSKSDFYKATVLKGKPNIQLDGSKPHRAQKLNKKEHSKVTAKTSQKIEATTAQGFIDRPSSPQTESECREGVMMEDQSSVPRCSHLPLFADFQMADEKIIPKDHTLKESECREGVMMEDQSSVPRCSHLPLFADFQMADEKIIPKDHTLKGGDVELGRSADGAHMAQTRAGSVTGSVQNAAGPLDKAKCHIYHKDATVAKTKATVPGEMDRIQTWNSSGRCPLQNAQLFTGTGHDTWSLPANCFLWFPAPEVDPLNMVVNPLFSSNVLPPPIFGLNPYYIVGDFSLWLYQHGNYVNFPDNVNPSAAGRQRFTCLGNVPPGFTPADAFTLF
ncbi:uncharacterized protein c19h1orf94 isoform X2 [Carassius auratus]|uniref:Uncharacterized protein c19h1orf94 isoform X2 n=1 Tax=Carassius auratus TaxID=7957 RepID=A0A6P6RGS8_CARAU|nr:uncharacterized protein LOC113119405 isoform X2 [Carassius auratus]